MVACKECEADDGCVKGKSGLCDSCADFHRGYDQAVREVMSEVKKRDAPMWKTIRRTFPLWGRLTQNTVR